MYRLNEVIKLIQDALESRIHIGDTALHSRFDGSLNVSNPKLAEMH